MSSAKKFYDALADHYHLLFEDWDRSIERQRAALIKILAQHWHLAGGSILDTAVGIGTQALGLIQHGYSVVGSDISTRALSRVRDEASRRNLTLALAAADFRYLPFKDAQFDAAIACDNALPHLLSVDEIRSALREIARCVRPGGGVVLSMRDYSAPPVAGTIEKRPYGERMWNGRRFYAEQEWRWQGSTYQLVLRIQSLDDANERLEVESTYLAVSVATVLDLMKSIGLVNVARVDDVYYQPVLVGTVRRAA